MKTAFIFDLDGVLVDTDKLHKISLRIAGSRFGFKGIPDTNAMTTVDKLRAAGVGEDLIEPIYTLKRKIYEEMVDDVVKQDEKIVAMLHTVKSVGKKLAVCSNSNINSVTKVLKKIGVEPLFDALLIVTSSHVSKGKPEPDIYSLTMHCLNVEPEDVYVFEDSDTGELSARRAGIFDVIRCDYTTIIEKVTRCLES